MPKIAIIGAGFSGLGLCYHLLQQKGNYAVVLFDPEGVGGSASGLAAGLLHPYRGITARLSWRGNEAMEVATALLKVASRALGKRVSSEKGVVRLALNHQQEKAFRERSREEIDVKWWNAQKCSEHFRGIHFLPGIFIRSGQTVYSALYLKGLWRACEQLGARLEKKEVAVKDLTDFNQVVIAAGGGIRKFQECASLAVTFSKGQLLKCKKPSYFNPKCSVIGRGYLSLSEEEDMCYIGSTYEHEFFSEEPCMGSATDEIFSRVGQFLPTYRSFQVLSCFSGMRVSHRKTDLPLIGRLKNGLWILTAMGSSGLLYHGLMGRELARALVANDERLIPKQVRI